MSIGCLEILRVSLMVISGSTQVVLAQDRPITAEVVRVLRHDSTSYSRVIDGGHATTLALSAAGTVDVFDSAGHYVGVIGRRGTTLPANATPTSIGFIGGRVWIFDPGSGQVFLFDRDAQHPTSQGTANGSPATGLFFSVDAVSSSGAMISTQSATMAGIARLEQQGRIVLRTSKDGAKLDTLGRLNIAHATMQLRTPAQTIYFRAQPWSAVDLIAFPSGAQTGYILRQPAPDSSAREAVAELQRFDFDSGVIRTISVLPYDLLPISVQMERAMVDSIMPRGFAERFMDSSAARRAVREVLYVPKYLPFVTKMIVSREGTAYLQQTARRWLAFNPASGQRQLIEIPAGIELQDADGDRLVGIRRDANSLEIADLRIPRLCLEDVVRCPTPLPAAPSPLPRRTSPPAGDSVNAASAPRDSVLVAQAIRKFLPAVETQLQAQSTIAILIDARETVIDASMGIGLTGYDLLKSRHPGLERKTASIEIREFAPGEVIKTAIRVAFIRMRAGTAP